MFDFGWQEFMMVAFVLVLVVGPKDLPKVLRGFTKFTRQARHMAREFTQSLEEVGADDNIREVKTMVADLKSGNLEDMAKAIDGDGDGIGSELGKIKEDIDLNQIGQDVREVQKAGRDDARKPVAVPKSNASKSAGKSVATSAKKKQAGTSTPAKQKKA
ncbi:MAG: Sec-independent protein translocase protein TatB [Candidatus Puniceispirillaceae bacterium]